MPPTWAANSFKALGTMRRRRHPTMHNSLPSILGLVLLFSTTTMATTDCDRLWSNWMPCCCEPTRCGTPAHQYRFRNLTTAPPTLPAKSSFRGHQQQQQQQQQHESSPPNTNDPQPAQQHNTTQDHPVLSSFLATSSSFSSSLPSVYCQSTYSVRLCRCDDDQNHQKQYPYQAQHHSVNVSYGTSLIEALHVLGITNFTQSIQESKQLASHLYRTMDGTGVHFHHRSNQQSFVAMVVRSIASFMYSFGGVVPFYPQYHRIRKTRNDKGFSTTVCLILLVAMILRVQFWMLKHFQIALLLQSLSMMGAQLLLLELCIHVRTGKITLEKDDKRNPRFWVSPITHFWAWYEFSDYLIFIFLFGIGTSTVTYFFSFSSIYAELLGSLSVGVEATIMIPQCIKNYERQSTEGLSYAMMVMWVFGDFLKLVYLTASEVPIQFVICTIVQCSVDVVVMLQISLYADTKNPKRVSVARRLSYLMRSDVNLSRRKKSVVNSERTNEVNGTVSQSNNDSSNEELSTLLSNQKRTEDTRVKAW